MPVRTPCAQPLSVCWIDHVTRATATRARVASLLACTSVTDDSVEVLLSPWQKVLGLMKDIHVARADVSDVRVVPEPLGEVSGSGLKAGLRLPGFYYVARTIRLDRAFLVRRGVPALSFAVHNEQPLRSVLVHARRRAARAGSCRRPEVMIA